MKVGVVLLVGLYIMGIDTASATPTYSVWSRTEVFPDNHQDDDIGPPSYIVVRDAPGQKARVVVSSDNGGVTPETRLRAIHDLKATKDGRYAFFSTSAWATSSAVHRYDWRRNTQKYIMPGSLECIREDGGKIELLAVQHRYFVHGGSYDPLVSFDQDGKELGIVDNDPSPDTIAHICHGED